MSPDLLSADILKIGDSEVFFRSLLESAPDAMIIVDRLGHMVLVNAQASEMFGYERDEMLDQPIEMLLPKALRKSHVAHRNGFIKNPSLRPMGQNLDLTAVRKDATEFPVEISLSPIATESGDYISSVIRDVTLRQELEDEIKAARETAIRANKANSAFLAAASHDLRQPVQALSLLNGALRRTVKDERALQMVESQDASLTAMTNLLNSLLDISRLDAGAVTPEWEDFPIQRLVDRLSPEFGRQARAKKLRFVADSTDAMVHSDPNLLAEIITNFVSNAIRYTDQGEVRMSAVVKDGCCRVEVVDTGIGIEADQLEEIFREFHQCKLPGASKQGFGLGLAIVRRLADLLDHPVEVQSEAAKGSSFSVLVPISAADKDYVEEETGKREVDAQGSGVVILIEDDVSVADAWSLLLEVEGYTVVSAVSATEASALIKGISEPPILLISDFHLLDGSTGVEAVSLIREHYDTEIPAFIVSGDTSKVVKEARLLDNCTLMSKPVDTARLLAAAHTAVVTGNVPED